MGGGDRTASATARWAWSLADSGMARCFRPGWAEDLFPRPGRVYIPFMELDHRAPPSFSSRRPTGRPVRVAGVDLQSLGSVALAGLRVHLLSDGGVDVLLTARALLPGDGGAFVSTMRSRVSYATWPEGAEVSAGTLAALRVVGHGLAARRDAASAEGVGDLEPLSAADVVALVPPPEGLAFEVGLARAGGFSVHYASAGERVTWRLRDRGPGEAGVLAWALHLEESADASRSLADRSLAHLVAVLAAVAGACGLHVGFGRSEAPSVGVFAKLDEPVDAALAALEGATPGAARVDLVLDVPSDCACACRFCTKAGRRADPDPRVALERARSLVPLLLGLSRGGSPVSVELVGDDALRFPLLDDLLTALVAAEPDSLGVVTPGTTLASPAEAERLAATGLAPRITMTLHGPDAATHDHLAGLPGAFDRLKAAVRRCHEAGLPVRLHHVLVADALPRLADTLALARALTPDVRLVAFASEPQHHEAAHADLLARTLPDPARVRAALAEHADELRGRVGALVGFVACVVPEALTDLRQNGGAPPPDLPAEPPAACRRCAARPGACPGPDRGTLALYGEAWLQPR
jgi:hypothetical protein